MPTIRIAAGPAPGGRRGLIPPRAPVRESMQRIAIIGLGLIGGSIGLAHQAQLDSDRHRRHGADARDRAEGESLGAIDVEARTPEEAVRDARLVIIASPIWRPQSSSRRSRPSCCTAPSSPTPAARRATSCAGRRSCCRTARTSSAATRWRARRRRHRRRRPRPLPRPDVGDRAVGDGGRGGGADRGRPRAALRRERCSSWTRDEHDCYVAAISHLPLALSSALFSVAFGSAAWPELRRWRRAGSVTRRGWRPVRRRWRTTS